MLAREVTEEAASLTGNNILLISVGCKAILRAARDYSNLYTFYIL